MNEELAVMSSVRYGVNAHGVGLSFTVWVVSGSGADIQLDLHESTRVIKESGVEDVSKLEGAPCIVLSDGDAAKFVSMYKPGEVRHAS